MQAGAEAQFRRTQQALQPHLDEAEKQLQTLRSGQRRGDQAEEPVITPDQRCAMTRHGRISWRRGRNFARCSRA